MPSAITISPISTMAAFLRPMYCDNTPSGKRIKAPASIGTEIMKPFWAGESPYSSLMKGPMAPLSTQTAKQKSKYKNEAARVGQWPERKKVLKFDMGGWCGLLV